MEEQPKIDEPAARVRWQTLRTLSCLGHIDLHFDASGIQIVVAPPVLAALPDRSMAKAVLCGARSPTSVENLRETAIAGGVEAIVGLHGTPNHYVPTRVELRADNSAQIHTVAASINLRYIDFPPARSLARVSASLEEYLRGLVWSNETELNWRRQDFEMDRLQFRATGKITQQLRLSRYQNPVTSVWCYRLWRNHAWAEVELDWGRYAVLASSSRRILHYDLTTRRTYVPYGAPLPALFSRALGLCSGSCSTLSGQVPLNGVRGCYVFYDVPPSIFNAVASKLRQQPIGMKGKRWTS